MVSALSATETVIDPAQVIYIDAYSLRIRHVKYIQVTGSV